jgi:branched-chain amino acid aminotransferase
VTSLAPVVWFNGALVDANRACVPAASAGLLSGLGAFETLRTRDRRPFRLAAHLERLRATLAVLELDLPEPDAELTAAVASVVEASGEPEVRIRITATAGTSGDPLIRMVEARPLAAPSEAAYSEGIALVSVPWSAGVGPASGHKLTSHAAFVLARRQAVREGAAEALLVTPEGVVVEAAHANVFAVHRGVVLTPPLGDGPLPGITRAIVLSELAPALGFEGREARLDTANVSAADEVFLTSSVAGVLPAVALDGRPVGKGRPGPVTLKVLEAYRELAG